MQLLTSKRRLNHRNLLAKSDLVLISRPCVGKIDRNSMNYRKLWISGVVLCVSVLLLSAKSFPQCQANAGNNVTICQGESVTLGGNPSAVNAGPGVTYDWNNGANDVANPVVSPNTTTTYSLDLTGGGCSGQSDQITVTVLPSPDANFTFSPNTACAGTIVTFTNTSTACAGCTYAWNFGNPASGSANTSAVANPTHVFVAPGNGSSTFTVSLTVTSSGGCADVHTSNITIAQSPTAVLNEDANFTQCLGVNEFYAYFTNASTGTAAGTTYTINFGDGSPIYSSATPPSGLEHVYTGINIWTLTYTATNTNGCSDVETYEVSNITNPAIGAATLGNTLQCGPVEFCFPLSNYTNNHPSTVYNVSFGDGSPVQSFNHPPPALVCYTYSSSSCANTPQFFTFSITADNNCTPSTATISPIQIYTPPAAGFTAPPAACANSAVPFINTTIPGFNQGCNSSTNYSWNFGDPASGANNTSTAANPTHVYAAPGTYTVTLTASNAGNPVLSCGSTTITQTICIEQPPTPVFTVNNNVGCVPMALTTTNTTSNAFASCNTNRIWDVTYSDLPCDPDNGTFAYTGGTNSSSLSPSFLLSSAGIYTIELEMTNSCGTFIDTETITVNTVPEVGITPITSVCAGTAITPSASVNGCNLPVLSYAWTFPGGSPASSNVLSPGPVSYTAAGNYAMTLTAVNACGPASASTSVNVLAPPNVTIAASNANNQVCAGSSIVLTASGAGSYSWSPSSGLSTTSGSSVTATPGSTVTYTVTGTSGSCVDQETITVTVNTIPNVTASGTFTMCQGETEQLGVTVNSGLAPYTVYSWSSPATLNNPNSASPVSSATVTTNYTVQVTDSNGCTGSGTVPLTVNTPPAVNAGPDISLCNQPVATTLAGFSPTTGGTGTWTGPDVTSAGVFTPTGLGAFTLTYCFTSASTGCNACDQMVVTVVDPTPANGGPDVSLCLNSGPFQLATNGTWAGNAQVTATGVFTPNTVGSFALTFTTGTGSCQQSDQVLVTVLPLPVTNAGPDQTVCAGAAVQLNASSNSPNGPITLFSWSGGTVSNSIIANPTAAFAVTTTLNVTAVDASGCGGADQITIIVNPLPAVNAGSDAVLCNQPVTTTLVPVTPASGGTWSGSGITPGGSFTPVATGTFTVTYTFTNPSTQCTNSDDLVITVNAPVQANAGPDLSVCVNGPAIQLPNTQGGTWSPAPVSSTGQFNPTATGVYALTYTTGTGTCLTTDQMVLTVNALPAVNAGPNVSICLNESTPLNAAVAGGQMPYNYSWTFPATLSNPLIANPIATPALTTSYTLTVTDFNQCVGSDQVLVTVNGLPVVEAGSNLTLCNQPIPEVLTGFSPSSGGTGSWSGPGITNPSGTFVSPGVGSYWLIYEFTAGGNSCSASDSIQVIVTPPVIANAGADLALCLNEGMYQLTGFSPLANYTWTGPGIAGPTSGTFNPALAGVGTHTLTIQTGSGTCFSSDQLSVQVLPLPAVTAGPEVSICGNAPSFVQTGFQPATGGVWEGPGVTNATTGNFDPAIGPGDYTLTFWFESPVTGCADSAFQVIHVSPVPTASFTLDPSGCTNAPADIQNNSLGATQYEWDFGNGFSIAVFDPTYTYPSEGSFTVTLTAANNFGCEDVTTNDHEIIAPPIAEIALTPTEGCAPLAVSFTNTTLGQYISYNWNFGTAGPPGTLANPPALTFQQGPDVMIYPVSLTATNYCGSSTANETVTVYPQPVASFGTDLDVFCSPFTVNINNTSVGNPDTFNWDFGDGGPGSTLEEPGGHIFFADTVAVDYTIWLYLSNECGADTANYTITVLPNTVTSFFNTDITWGCNPLTVQFTDFSEGGTQIQYDFGGGNFTGDANPTFTFDDPGNYEVFQYVDNGCSYDTSSIVLAVYPSPVINFDIEAPFVCEGEGVQFTSSPGDAISLEWDFGDGGMSYLSNPVYAFENSGTFTVSLTGTSDNGCTATVSQPFTTYAAPDASFTIPSLLGCSPFNACFTNTTSGGMFYSWDFGNGNTSNVNSPCFNYQNFGADPQLYTVSLIAQNMQLCADTFAVNVIVAPQPVSQFSLSQTESCYFPVLVNASNESQFANGYEWTINSTSESTLINPAFSLNEVGLYQIELLATNQFGCEHSSDQLFIIHPLPAASFMADETDGCVNHEVQFTNTSEGAVGYLWIFGDGQVSNEDEPAHTYSIPGVYDVGLVVITDQGCQDTLIYDNYVSAYNLPVADFIFTPEDATIYDPEIIFLDQSIDAVQWLWNFGDGTTSEQENVQHYFPDAGVFDINLRVWNQYGCTHTHTDRVFIEDIFNIYVPNAFTPDDDGINEAFRPEMSGTRFIEDYTFQVFDRWGTVIFETRNPEEPWIGNVRDGEYFAKDDVYNWQVIVQLKGSDKPRIYSGNVTLVR